VESETEYKLEALGLPTKYAFDRPFLLYLKKRDAKSPFLVMWNDNANLLQKM
jgi:hypothetical protein